MIITTKYGSIRSFEKNGCSVCLGIPFAAPTVGELAFKHPVPPSPWEGILDAASGSCNPIQAEGGFYIGNNSLDCLYLNVFAPKGTSEPLPVMVWIYGGSYSQGGAGVKEHGSADVHYSGPVWRYEYRYAMPGSGMGCFHASELPVLFGLSDIFGKVDDPKSQKVGVDMRSIWSGFAYTGRTAWEEYGKDASVHAVS